jgi:hypothetical protein
LPHRRLLCAAALGLSALAVGCGTGDDAADDSAPIDDEAVSEDGGEPGVELDQSTFCVTIRQLEAMGRAPDGGDGSPEAALAQTAEMRALLDEAAATAPDDAPPDVQALLDDYGLLTAAIEGAGGDTAAAFEALSTGEPELMARLTLPAAGHADAFSFFADRCGIAASP